MIEFEETIKILDKISSKCDVTNAPWHDRTWWIDLPIRDLQARAVFIILKGHEFYFCDHQTFRSGFELLEHIAGYDEYIAKLLAEPMA
jgi:hypothetical protein